MLFSNQSRVHLKYKLNFQLRDSSLSDASSNLQYFHIQSTDLPVDGSVVVVIFFFAPKIRWKQNDDNKLWQLSVKIFANRFRATFILHNFIHFSFVFNILFNDADYNVFFIVSAFQINFPRKNTQKKWEKMAIYLIWFITGCFFLFISLYSLAFLLIF